MNINLRFARKPGQVSKLAETVHRSRWRAQALQTIEAISRLDEICGNWEGWRKRHSRLYFRHCRQNSPNNARQRKKIQIGKTVIILIFIKIILLYASINRAKKAAKKTVKPASYQKCLEILRDQSLSSKFFKLCGQTEQLTHKEYNFVLYYLLMRIIFRNGARAEIAYKSENRQIFT